MDDCLTYCKKYLFLFTGLFVFAFLQAQQSASFEINTSSYSKRGVVFNALKECDSILWKGKDGRLVKPEMISCNPLLYEMDPDIVLYEAEGSALCIDTTGRFYLKDMTAESPKRVYLGSRIDTFKLGRKDVVLEADNRDLVNLDLYAVPLAKYTVAQGPPAAVKITFSLEEIIYGARGKVPPRILEQWAAEIKIDPENRNVIHEFKLLLPRDLVKKGSVTFMIYDLSFQVVRIYPNLNKTVNILKRDNIATGTYIYKIFYNGDEELKKQMLRFLSPEEVKE